MILKEFVAFVFTKNGLLGTDLFFQFQMANFPAPQVV